MKIKKKLRKTSKNGKINILRTFLNKKEIRL